MNVELDKLRANNDQLEKTVVNLQRKIHLCNKEVADLNGELTSAHRERDEAIENCARNDELLNRMVSNVSFFKKTSFSYFYERKNVLSQEKEKEQLAQQLARIQEENQSVSSSMNSVSA